LKQVHLSYLVERTVTDELHVELMLGSDIHGYPNATFTLGTTRYYLHFLHGASLRWDDDVNFEATERARQQLIAVRNFDRRLS
jgi:hypothetical protein